MSLITSIAVVDGDAPHITAQLLNQNGNPIPGATFVFSLGTPATPPVGTFVADASNEGGVFSAQNPGNDSLTATSEGITGSLPITVVAPVPTSIAFSSP